MGQLLRAQRGRELAQDQSRDSWDFSAPDEVLLVTLRRLAEQLKETDPEGAAACAFAASYLEAERPTRFGQSSTLNR